MMLQMIETAIATELGHLQVHAPGFEQNPQLRFRLPDGGRAAMDALEGRPEVSAYARRVRGEGLISSPRANAGVRVLGIDPGAEARVSSVAGTVVRGAYLDGEERRVLLGEELARRLRVDVGSKVVLSVQDLSGDLTGEAFRVGGLFRSASGEIDRTTVFVRLAESQQLLGLAGAISELVVVARQPEDIPAVKRLLEQTLGDAAVVRTWEELRPFLVQILELLDQTGWAMYAAVFVAMMFGIANVLLMSVFERTREIGVVLALGMQPSRIVTLVVLESLWLTLLGLGLGYGVAVLGVFLLRDGIDLSAFASGLSWMGVGTRIVPVLRAYDLVVPVSVALITATLASLWPSLRAGRLRPAEAMRHV